MCLTDVSFQNGIPASVNNYNAYQNQGDIILSTKPTILEDVNGREVENLSGGHAVTVTGTTADGRLIVSSWGEEYYVNPATYDNSPDTERFLLQVVTYE